MTLANIAVAAELMQRRDCVASGTPQGTRYRLRAAGNQKNIAHR
jgi:hypothetical protein